MGTDIQTALSLLVIGMLSVFVILSLVVLAGRTLIGIVNKYFSETSEEKIVKIPTSVYRPSAIPREKLAVIAAAVEAVELQEAAQLEARLTDPGRQRIRQLRVHRGAVPRGVVRGGGGSGDEGETHDTDHDRPTALEHALLAFGVRRGGQARDALVEVYKDDLAGSTPARGPAVRSRRTTAALRRSAPAAC